MGAGTMAFHGHGERVGAVMSLMLAGFQFSEERRLEVLFKCKGGGRDWKLG